MSEQIGKHKGAIETLLHEKKELSRLLQIVNSQLQNHMNALDEAGVDTDEFLNQIQGGTESSKEDGNQRSRSQNRSSNKGKNSEDTGDLLEGENDTGSRDFNPNR